MPLAGGVLEHVAGAFVAVVQGQRVGIGFVARGRRKVFLVASGLGDADFVDGALKIPTNEKRAVTERRASCLGLDQLAVNIQADLFSGVDARQVNSAIRNDRRRS